MATSEIDNLPAERRPRRQKTERLRVALIGCGAISQQMHLPVLAGHEAIDLSILVDRDINRAQEFATGYGVHNVLSDAGELSDDMVDAAIVATPPFHHAPCSIELMKKGIHVLVEKPMATNHEDAVEMVTIADAESVVLAVGFFRRLYPSIRLMKSLLDSEWLGPPKSFHVEGGGMYNWPAATLGNMRREWAGGGVLIDFGSHMLDLLLALFDQPAEVMDCRTNSRGGIESDCTIRLRVSHSGRPIEGDVELARTRNLGALIRVVCERGSLEFLVNERFRVRIRPSDNDLVDSFDGNRRDFWLDASWEDESENTEWFETFRTQIDDFVAAIQSPREARLSGRSSLLTSRLIADCYRQEERMDEPWVDLAAASPHAPSADGGGNGSHQTSVKDNHRKPVTSSGPPRVLITGATGFIGARAAEIFALQRGWNVRALVHNPGNASRLARLPVEMIQGDLASEETAAKLVRDCDAVVHCAVGTVWGDRRRNFAINVEGTRRLAEAAQEAGVRRFVHFSTISVYGDDTQITGTLDESRPLRPPRGGDYGETKAAAESVIRKVAADGLNACIFRPARVFGPFSRIFITNPLTAMADHAFHWLGSPDVPSDMVFVDNLLGAVLRALDAPDANVRGQDFNIGDEDPMTWREFYEYFAHHLDLDLADLPIDAPRDRNNRSIVGQVVALPVDVMRATSRILTSTEFKSLGRCALNTDPIGSGPRWMLQKFPSIERAVRRIVGADDSLPIHIRKQVATECRCRMGSGGALVSIAKARKLLGYEPPVSRANALQTTLEWVRHARLTS